MTNGHIAEGTRAGDAPGEPAGLAPPLPDGAVHAIETSGLTKRYAGGVRALSDVHLRVGVGEIFGLLGPNGAGKSTLIRILLDMIRPTAGWAAIHGFDTQADGVTARGHVGYLPSSPQFYARMTAADMFEFAAAARGVTVDDGYVASLVERFDLNPGRVIRTLSRGNQQKVGLVVALMAKPELVILDEPTTGLDPLMQEQVLDVVRDVVRDGRTVFFSSHILHEVEHVCDQVGVLRGGRLVGVFDLAAQRRLASRTVVVTFDAPVPPERFAGIEGVTLASASGARLAFNVADGIDELLKRLAEHTVLTLDSHEPTLEDFFFSLYQQNAQAEAVR